MQSSPEASFSGTIPPILWSSLNPTKLPVHVYIKNGWAARPKSPVSIMGFLRIPSGTIASFKRFFAKLWPISTWPNHQLQVGVSGDDVRYQSKCNKNVAKISSGIYTRNQNDNLKSHLIVWKGFTSVQHFDSHDSTPKPIKKTGVWPTVGKQVSRSI